MFNNLSKDNKQTVSPVDDIFAETEQTPITPIPTLTPTLTSTSTSIPISAASSNPVIETGQIGLSATDNSGLADLGESRHGSKFFKIVLILIVIAVLGLGGYVVYTKFFQDPAISPTVNNQNNNLPTPSVPNNSAYVPGTILATTTPDVSPINPLEIIEEPAAGEINSSSTGTTTVVVTPPLDTDSDGLTDNEEALAGTNINLADTDKDGLSDYEEVRIYLTNPLNTDSDGDGYLDGAEVNSGYNPNGTGKLPGV